MNYFTNYNPYYQQPMQPQMQRPMEQYQPQQFQPQQFQTQTYKPAGLQGKIVDSLEVVKAIDIPLDGTVSYFPTADGSMIVTKQLKEDGTSKTVVYKPDLSENIEKVPNYITEQDLDEKLKNISDNRDLKEEIKNIKRQIKDMASDLEELSERKN